MRDPGLNTVTTAASALADLVDVPAPYDRLSSPSNDDMIGAGLTLWPVGAAFGSPDAEAVSLTSIIARLTRVLISPFERLYARAYKLALESIPRFADELLAEWEADYGLPDSCVGGESSVAERVRALETKVSAVAVVTPGDFIRLAATYGFRITIVEPAIFRCGFSRCGGQHTVGHPRQEVYWIVRVTDLTVDYFRAGSGRCGYTPLFSYGDAERLLCLMRRYAPGWTIPLIADD